jgi:hypothetical protein
MPGRKIRPVNWYSIFLPHIFLLLSVGVELPNRQIISGILIKP